jgi:hypothetical protein
MEEVLCKKTHLCSCDLAITYRLQIKGIGGKAIGNGLLAKGKG